MRLPSSNSHSGTLHVRRYSLSDMWRRMLVVYSNRYIEGLMTEDVLESNRIYQEAWSQFATASRHGEVTEDRGTLIATAGVVWPGMNLAFLGAQVSSSDELAQRVAVAKRFFADRNRAWLFVLFENWVDSRIDARSVLTYQGLRFVQESIGMRADRLSLPNRHPPNLRYSSVADARALHDFAAVNAESYGIPFAWAQQAVQSGHHWNPPAKTHVGYLDDEAVVTTMTRPIGEVLFVGWVATKPARQKQGCAEALMRYALHQSDQDDGKLRSVLHATPAGLGLYAALGYRRVARFELYFGGTVPGTMQQTG